LHRPDHKWHRKHQGTPGIAGTCQNKRGDHSRCHDQGKPTPPLTQTRLQDSRQCQWPDQHQPGTSNIGVIKQTGKTPGGLPPGRHEPDDQTTSKLPWALPSPPELTKPGDHNRNSAGNQPENAASAGRPGDQIGLKSPEAKEKRQPVTKTNPGQPTGVGDQATQQHQQGGKQQRPVPGIPPAGSEAPEQTKQKRDKQQCTCQ